MHEFMKGNIHTLNMDYDEFNREVIDDFYSLIDSLGSDSNGRL